MFAIPTLLPLDDDKNPIPAIRLKSGGGAHMISASSTRNGTPLADDTRIISLYATVPVYVRFGGSGVTATTSDHFFPPESITIFQSAAGRFRITRTLPCCASAGTDRSLFQKKNRIRSAISS